MRYFTALIFLVIFFQNVLAQDSIIVQTLTRDSAGRRGVYEFPDDANQSFRKIWMVYNMRCKGAKVGVSGVGCGEWDYSCNTFITDSSRVDSSLATNPSYVISGFSGSPFEYRNEPVYTYYQYIQKEARYTSSSNEKKYPSGAGGQRESFNAAGGTFRGQYLFTAQELIGFGLKAGNISAMELAVLAQGAKLPNFRIRMKATGDNEISSTNPHTEGWSEVYYRDVETNTTGTKRFQFYTPFNWNGTSNVMVDVSFSKFNKAAEPEFSFNELSGDKQAVIAQQAEQSLVFDGVSGQVQGGKLSQIKNEITIGFWSYGTAHYQPVNNSILEVNNKNDEREINIHLPWSNGGIYFDCGNENGSYDRIEKAAGVNDYERQWVHWTFTKNATTGIMNIYRNGSLWLSGSGKTKPIDCDIMKLGEAVASNNTYFGRIREFSIWNKELDSLNIQSWKNRSLNDKHPFYHNLLFYFSMQNGGGNQIVDQAPIPQSADLSVALDRHQERGDKMVMNFVNSKLRPNFSFIQGTYNGFVVDDFTVLDSIINGPKKVQDYKVVNNNLVLDSTYYLNQAGDLFIYREDGEVADAIYLDPDGALAITTLKYYRKRPAKYELLSLVTPYGNNLDLGKDGKTFVFDVTDFTPILRGRKYLSMELGGEFQEEIDLKFIFIKGTPERKVLDVANVWPFDRGYFNEIYDNTKFEPRKTKLRNDAKYFNIRSSVTGHEQNGEFTSKKHFVSVNGSATKKFQFDVWKECGSNPIYPQGGTWIFDRAGWCPGAPTELFRFDLTPFATPGADMTLDYGIELPALSQANYLVSTQLVSYGPYSFKNDASLEEIKRPNAGRVEFDRLNPSCNSPLIKVRNSGENTLSALTIKYGRRGGSQLTYRWTGSIMPSEEKDIELPLDVDGFWNSGTDTSLIFEVLLSNPNDQMDDHVLNNYLSVPYKNVDKYGSNLHLEFKTNNVAIDNSYRIVNNKGQNVLTRNGLAANVIYRDELALLAGCYTLIVNDVANDGLSFWFYPNNGSGFARLSRKLTNNYAPLKNFNPDFGAGFQYDFVVDPVLSVNNEWQPQLLSITPNPTLDILNVEYKDENTEPVYFQLLNFNGHTLKKEIRNGGPGLVSVRWSLSELPAGIYFVKINQKEKTVTRKIIKQ